MSMRLITEGTVADLLAQNSSGVHGDQINPERIGTIRPDYPRNARTAKIEGDVRLEAVILPDGKVTQVRVLLSPNPALNTAAIRAVQQSTYKPGFRNGKPDTFTIEVTVSFRLQWRSARFSRQSAPDALGSSQRNGFQFSRMVIGDGSFETSSIRKRWPSGAA